MAMKKNKNRMILAQFGLAVFLCGVVWFVQVVHYPLMSAIGPDQFLKWHERHVRQTGWIVIVPMLAELVVAGWWLYRTKDTCRTPALAGSVLLVIVWIATFFGAVPAHDRLAGGFDVATHESLMFWNLVRSIAWGGRSLLFGVLLFRIVEPKGAD